MKRLGWLMALILGFGLVIGFSGCIIDEDTISKADRCGMADVKFQQNCEESWNLNECMNFPNGTISCVLGASGPNVIETCDAMYDCLELAYACEDVVDIIYQCGFDDELELESWYDAWEQCVVEIDEETLACILGGTNGYSALIIIIDPCYQVAQCLGLELPPL